MASCEKCPRLVKTRKQVVQGRGDADAARIIIFGEAPGPEENDDGSAFVGRSGKRLNEMLAKLKTPNGEPGNVDDFYIWNTCSCWPAQLNTLTDPPKWENAKPTAEEIGNCRPWVERLVRIIDPIALVLAGEYACLSFGLKGSITKLRENMHDVFVQGVERKVAYCAQPIFHPAYLLRTADKPQLQKATEDDLQGLYDRSWAYLRIAQGMSPVAPEGA